MQFSQSISPRLILSEQVKVNKHKKCSYSTKEPKLVIIGGVAGGATAAARARRLNEHAEIVIYERGDDISFANCGLPYYIAGEIKSRNKLALHTPQSFHNLLNVKVFTRKEVTKINRELKEIEVRDMTSGEKGVENYDKLIISTGAAPVRPPIEGINHPSIYTLRNLNDMDKIHEKITKSESAMVVGAGFIGLEMVEALVKRGVKDVTLVEFRDHVLPILDLEMTSAILAELQSNGVKVFLNHKVVKFESVEANGKISASLSSTSPNSPLTSINTDLVILSTGVSPESHLAIDANINVHPQNKTILVNEFMQTNDPDIYAVGDVISSFDPIYNESSWVPLAGPANRQGRIAADHILFNNIEDKDNEIIMDNMEDNSEKNSKYRGNLGTSIVRVFDMVAASTGFTEQALKRMKREYEYLVVSGTNHASYYPHSTPILLKVIWDKESRRLLGAQANGVDGVDKRIDVLATAIFSGMKVDDLAHLELTYSPPFGSARDVINTAGFAAINMKKKIYNPAYSLDNIKGDVLLLDVRDKDVVNLHPLENSVNIPLSQLRDRMNELPKDKKIITVCSLGKTSYFASRILNQCGFNAQSLIGGLSLHSINPPSNQRKINNFNNAINNDNNKNNNKLDIENKEVIELDMCGVACPGPILGIRKKLFDLKDNQVLKVTSSDGGFYNDFPAFCKANNLHCIDVVKSKGIVTGRLCKLDSDNNNINNINSNSNISNEISHKNDVAIVVFSGELDKVLAAMVIANGAVAMGGSVTLFFTFWGLNALRTENHHQAHDDHNSNNDHEEKEAKKKSLMDKAMGMMMPRGVDQLPLSNFNFGGMGATMMKNTMKKKNLPTLPGLMKEAKESGKVRFVACTMSMEALSIGSNELVEFCEYGGVADFLAASSSAKTTLFI